MMDAALHPPATSRSAQRPLHPLHPLLLLAAVAVAAAPLRADDEPQFFRAVNLNGPPVVIDGRQWEGSDAPDFACDDQAFENQSVELRPPTDPERARMIRSSNWMPDGRNEVVLANVPPGAYTVFLYVWEDNDPQTYSVALQGRTALENHVSGEAGHWDRLGPWICEVADDRILRVTSTGGHANFSGIEVWRGTLDAEPPDPSDPSGTGVPPVASADPEAVRFFDQRVAPILSRNCLGCHNATDLRGGLDLSHADSALAGGESGPVIVPGNPDESLLWERLEFNEMPPDPDLVLSDEDKQTLRQWIADGAAWGTDPINPFLFSTATRAGYDWWSLQPVVRPEPPAVSGTGVAPVGGAAGLPSSSTGGADIPVCPPGWPANPIDNFILAELHEHGLEPSPEAGRRTLIRRLYFDLIGLPPNPAEVQAFLADDSPDAYERLVDRLLDSPHYGERWARHWLDVIRYAESQGFERNRLRPGAWRYRDWLIEALNSDMPYDEFVRLQVAGDVLHPDDPLAVVATGFLVTGPHDFVGLTEGTEAMQMMVRQDEIEDAVGSLGQTFLGMTTHCARCHDHKFDPVFQREYYQLAACLTGITQGTRESLAEAGRPEAERRRADIAAQLEPLSDRRAAIEAEVLGTHGQPVPSQLEPVTDGLLALYTFDEAEGTIVHDRSGAADPLNLTISDPDAVRWIAPTNLSPSAAEGGATRNLSPSGGEGRVRASGTAGGASAAGLSIDSDTLIASEGPATRLIDALRQSNQITIEAWVTPADAAQDGPARIVTLSADTGQRNFTLGQQGNRFDVRLRTTGTDDNGMPSLTGPEGSIELRPMHLVYVRSTDSVARLILDGEERARQDVGGDFSNWNGDFRLALVNEHTRDRPWRGVLHRVAIYGRALSNEEIAQNYAAGGGEPPRPHPPEILAQLPPERRGEYRDLVVRISRLEAIDRLLTGGPAHAAVPQQPPATYMLARGDFRQPGDLVAPAGVAALGGVRSDPLQAVSGPAEAGHYEPSGIGVPPVSPPDFTADFALSPDAPEGDRRARLADWLTHPANPLTPRVIVNRLWHYHFGRGLIATPNDLGFNGGLPSHPELLDWLAAELIENGWSLKHLHRLIVTSATYRQSSHSSGTGVPPVSDTALDADNRLLWRMNPRRLEAEAVRDSILALSGELDPTMGGPGYLDFQHISGLNEVYVPIEEARPEFHRRSIYRTWVRSGTNYLLDTLDCPDPTVATPARTVTTTPQQALSLLNNEFVVYHAGRFAERLGREAGNDPYAQIALAYRLAYARDPTSLELDRARRFVVRHGLDQFCLVIFNSNEFLFVD